MPSKSNLKLQSFYLCENAFFSDDKKLNIIGVFDTAFSDNFPATYPLMTLAGTVIGGNPGKEVTLTVKIETPEDNPKTNEKKIPLTPSETGKYNFIVKIQSLIISKPGIYNFVVYHKQERLGETSFVVNLVKKGALNEKGRAS
jgi:hypothetical protein